MAKKEWCIAEAGAEFVCRMEDILDVYKRPYREKYPVVCLDESNKQFIKETRRPIPPKSGRVERYDTEYERNGTGNSPYAAPHMVVCNPAYSLIARGLPSSHLQLRH